VDECKALDTGDFCAVLVPFFDMANHGDAMVRHGVRRRGHV